MKFGHAILPLAARAMALATWTSILTACSPTTPAADGGAAIAGAACAGDPTLCISGSVTTSMFSAAPAGLQVELHRVFPSGLEAPIAVEPVSGTNSWAFSGLPPWDHYYVRVVAAFGVTSALSRVVGPVMVPTDGGAPLFIDLEPVEILVLESPASDGGLELYSATAHVFDPGTGAEIVEGGATVAMTVGDASVELAWDPSAAFPAYVAVPVPPPAAQGHYTLTVAVPSSSAAPTEWPLVANPPAYDAGALSVTSGPPSGDAGAPAAIDASLEPNVAAGQALTVTFSPEPEADYVQVELFEGDGGSWSLQYQSPAPETADTTQETIAGSFLVAPTEYLIDVAHTNANCPIEAAGCVNASVVAAEIVTAVPDSGAVPDGFVGDGG